MAFPRRWWYPVATAAELGARPVAVTVMDEPVVLFRDARGIARALVDRCPHRNVPLSLGRVQGDGTLQCAYHGWRFDGSGRCTAVPGLADQLPAGPSARDADSRPVRERDGVVWLWPSAEEPTREPFTLPDLGTGPNVGEVVFRQDMACTVHASVENALDVPHTAFLHGGLFRRPGRGPTVRAVRRDVPDGVEVQYLDEPAAFGPVRLRGRTFDHWDRFFLPSIAQVEYRIGDVLRIVNSILHLPLSATRTRAWFVLRFSSPLPAAVAGPIVRARGRSILRQDVEMLEQQTANVARFGGERYTSSELDLLGNAIWRLLRRAERAEQADPSAGDFDGDGDGESAAPAETPATVTLQL